MSSIKDLQQSLRDLRKEAALTSDKVKFNELVSQIQDKDKNLKYLSRIIEEARKQQLP